MWWVILIIVVAIAFVVGILNTPSKEKRREEEAARSIRIAKLAARIAEREKLKEEEEIEVFDDDGYFPGEEVAYYFINVVGERFDSGRTDRHRQDIIAELAKGEKLFLEAEPDNEYDPGAIVVLTQNGADIGYIPGDETDKIHPYLGREEYEIKVKASDISMRHDGLNVRLKINIYAK